MSSLLLALVILLASANPAAADTAGPTNYRSRVFSINPPTSAITARIVGGDSFFELRVRPGHRAVVIGYRGESYLRFDSDGRVEENEHSPSTFLNKSRFGTTAVPSFATADARPVWHQVASGGDWIWHDHRTHWMSPAPPLGRQPGQRILDAVVPLRVDGRRVDVRVVSTWLLPPPVWPTLTGFMLTIVLGVVAWRRLGTREAADLALVAVGACASVIGTWQYLSLPTATGPNPLWALLPIFTLGAAIWTLQRRLALREAVPLVAAVTLLTWATIRSPGMWRALIPTKAPPALDRATTAAALTIGSTVLLIGLTELVRSLTRHRSETM